MFEEIIQKLLKTNAPTTSKLKIPLAGIKAFEAITKLEEPANPEIVVTIAVEEFTKYSTGDSELIDDFKEILKKEFSKLNSPKLLKKKARALKEIWKTEARALSVKNRRNKWLSIRVTETEYETILKQAQQEGLDLSTYIRKKLGLGV